MPASFPDRRPSRSRSPLGDRGQAAIDYLGVVAVVALILGVLGTVTIGPSVVNGVGEAFQRALCKVTGDSCVALERPVCTVRTRATDVSVAGRALIIKVGRGMNLLRTERSDGTIELTLMDRFSGGVQLKATPSGRLMLGGRDLGISGVAQAAAIAELGGGKMWRVPDAAAADKLQDKLVNVMVGRGVTSITQGPAKILSGLVQKVGGFGSGTDLPEPTAYLGSLKGDVSMKFDPHFGTEVQYSGSGTVGGSKNVAGGGTIYLASSQKLSAAVLGGVGNLGLDGEVRLAVVVGADGKPSALVVGGSGSLKGNLTGTTIKNGSQPVFKGTAAEGRTVQISATLDLTAPESRAAVSRLMKALSPSGVDDLLGAARGVGRAIADHTRVDLATYASDEDSYGGGLDVPVAGASAEYKRTKTNLLDAWTRPAGGAWEQREDCLQA